MYVRKIEIENIRSIKHLLWEIESEQAPGWHVILGNNASGKSSFVRSVALVVVGTYIQGLNVDLKRWLRSGEEIGRILLQLTQDENLTVPRETRSLRKDEPIILSGEQLYQLQNALLSAFPDHASLERFVLFGLGEKLDVIVGRGKLSDEVFALIRWAEAMGKTKELVEQAQMENPVNSQMKSFVTQFLALPKTEESLSDSNSPLNTVAAGLSGLYGPNTYPLYSFPSLCVELFNIRGIFRSQHTASAPRPLDPQGIISQQMINEINNLPLFCASYGPFRRFTGSASEYEEQLSVNPTLARHATVFREDIALTESSKWLQNLRFKQLEQNSEGDVLEYVQDFINQEGFLPFGTRLFEVTSRDLTFIDGNGHQVSMEELSDGFRSILSLILDLIRHLVTAYGEENVFDPADPHTIRVPGVVLIDEVDAHLHPTWQRQIAVWLTRLFPNIQFIVTTHSPLVCQVAKTIFRLPTPGTEEEGKMISGAEFDRLRYGDILEAYSTEAFGFISRSEEGQQRLEKLAQLNITELQRELTEEEKQMQEKLRAAMPTVANTIDRKAVQ